MNILDEYKTYQTRRQFFSQGKNLLGTAALGSLLGGRMSASAGEGAISPHFPPDSETSDLFAYGWWPGTDGLVRLQAEDERVL